MPDLLHPAKGRLYYLEMAAIAYGRITLCLGGSRDFEIMRARYVERWRPCKTSQESEGVVLDGAADLERGRHEGFSPPIYRSSVFMASR